MNSSRRRHRIIIDTDSDDDSIDDDWMFLNQGLSQGKENENEEPSNHRQCCHHRCQYL